MMQIRTASLFLVTGAFFAIGFHVPLPGLDLEQVLAQTGDLNGLARFSVLAVGIQPIISILALVEAGRLALGYRVSQPPSSGGIASWPTLIIRGAVLALAALQGYGIATGLEAAGLVHSAPDTFFFTTIASFVAGIAVLLFLSSVIRIPGLRHGIWLLWSVAALPNLISGFVGSYRFVADDVVGPRDVLLLVAGVVAMTAISVSMTLIWAKIWNRVRSLRNDALGPSRFDILIWPPLLATIFADYCLAFLSAFFFDEAGTDALLLSAWRDALIVLFIPILVFGYVRMLAPKGFRHALAPAALLVACLQLLLLMGSQILEMFMVLPFSVSGLNIIVLTVTILAITGDRLKGVMVGFKERSAL